MADFHSQFDNLPYNRATLTTYDSRGGINQIKTGAGFLHSITFSQLDAAPTAGEITVYDSTALYGDTVILFKHSQTTAVFMPVTVILDIPFTNGLGVGFLAALKDVNVVLSYK